jgi:hypothetical protein
MHRLRTLYSPLMFLLLSAALAFSCGDKVLLFARGINFSNVATRHKGSVIVYTPSALSPAAAVSDIHFQTALKKAGYKLAKVQDTSVLADATRSNRYDVVLVDPQDVAAVNQQMSIASVNTIVIPVFDGEAERSAGPGHSGCIRKQDKNKSCFADIDRAIESKLKLDEQQRRVVN